MKKVLRWLLMSVFCVVSLEIGWANQVSWVTGITESVRDVTLSSPVDGIIGIHKVKEGDVVKKGSIIIELRNKLEELNVARLRLIRDRNKADYEATQQLFQNTKSISQEELEKIELEYRVADVEYQFAQEQLNMRLITAPMDGLVTDLFLDVGEGCSEQQPVARVVDNRHCYFITNIGVQEARDLQVGQEVTLEIESSSDSVQFQGKIDFLSPVVDPSSGLIKVKVLFENPEGKIRPGVAGKMLLRRE